MNLNSKRPLFLLAILLGINTKENCQAIDVSQYWISPTNNSIRSILNSISDELLLYLIPTIALLAIVIGGFYYIRAGQDEGKAGEGKKIIKTALTGLIIAFIAYWLVILVWSLTTNIVGP